MPISEIDYTNNKIDRIVPTDAIIGNPPYQVTTEYTSDRPVYNLFMDIAFKLSQRVTLITPARYLFNAGKTPKEWNEKILHDKHFKVVWYKADSTDVFPSVDIKGGVAVMFRNTNDIYEEINHYTAFPELNSIYKKVVSNNEDFSPLSDIIYPQSKFDLNILFDKHPNIKQYIGSGGQEKRLTTSIFSLTDVFFDKPQENSLKILGLVKGNRDYRWIKPDFIEAHPCLHKYKILVPKSNGTGAIGEVLSTPLIGEPLIGEPLIGVTQSFIQIGAFDNLQEATFALKYIKSRFARCLLGILKVTQDNSKDTWAFVPLQDFTDSSDIDWGKSIKEIDRQLYRKYGLDDEEIGFIEKMIKPME